MLRLFLKFLRECYTVPDEQITLTGNCFLNNGLVLDEIEAFWLDRLDLPRTCLRKAIINRPSSAGRAEKRTLLSGTARLAVHCTAIVQALYAAIQEYGDFERPEWLGCPPGGVVGRRS